MRPRALLTLSLALLLGLVACQSSVHQAKVLDIRLGVQITHLQLRMKQPKHATDVTWVDLDVSMSNPSDQRVWANNCRGQAVDDAENQVYTFSYLGQRPAGTEIEAHRTWKGLVIVTARVSSAVAATAVRATMTCQAVDWGDYPPI